MILWSIVYSKVCCLHHEMIHRIEWLPAIPIQQKIQRFLILIQINDILNHNYLIEILTSVVKVRAVAINH